MTSFTNSARLALATLLTACWLASSVVRAAQPRPSGADEAAPSAAPSDSAPIAVAVSPGPYYIGTVISATILVPDVVERPQIDIGPIRDFEARIFDAAPLPESARQRGFVFRLNLLPKKPGVLRVPPLAIGGTARRRNTAPLSLDVAEPESSADQSLTATLSATKCYVGQPLTLEVTWSVSAEINAVHAVDLRVPLLDQSGFESRDFSKPPTDFGTLIGLPVNNSRVIGGVNGRIIQFRKIIVPRKAGAFSIPGAAVLSSVGPVSTPKRSGLGPGFQYVPQYDNQFFSDGDSANSRRLYTRSPPLTVRVQALPEAGKPADFSGIVGSFSIDATVEPSTLREGEPLTLTVRVRNYAYAEVFDLPPWAQFPGFRGRFRIPSDRGVPTLEITDRGPEKVFRQSLRPISTGVDKVPAIRLPFFDPQTATYRFATAPEMPLRVSPQSIATGFDAVLSDGSRLKNILVSHRPGIGPNFPRSELLQPRLATWTETAGFWWIVIGLPPLVCAVILRVTRRARYRRWSPATERVLWAHADFRDATRHVNDPAALMSEVQTYLSRRLGLTLITFGVVEPQLREQGVAETDIRFLQELFAAADRRNFSHTPTAGDEFILTRKSVCDRVASIEAALARHSPTRLKYGALWALVGVAIFGVTTRPLQAASTADELAEAEGLFQAGITQQFDQPEAAKDALRKAAAGFEHRLGLAESGWDRGKLHYNAGTAHFFAGDFGEAIFHLRKAQRLLPANRRVRAALAYLRSQQPDSTSKSPLRRFWDSFWQAWETLNPQSWLLLLTAAYALFWVLLGLAAFWPSRALRRIVPMPLFLVGAIAIILGVAALSERLNQEGVVLESELVARKGPANIYEPAFETPIHAGVEFRLVGRRDDWLEVQLPGADESCWIPSSSAALLGTSQLSP